MFGLSKLLNYFRAEREPYIVFTVNLNVYDNI